MPNKDEIKGKANQAAGAIKDKAGELVGNPNLEAEGEAQRADGQIQEGYGKARRKVGDAVKKVGRKIGS